jgi:hypothetical protein
VRRDGPASAIYDELDEAQIQNPNQTDNRPRSVANVYLDLRQSRMLAINEEYEIPDINGGKKNDVDSAARVSGDHIPLEQVNSANSVNQVNPPNTSTGGQQQDEKDDRPLPPPPSPLPPPPSPLPPPPSPRVSYMVVIP